MSHLAPSKNKQTAKLFGTDCLLNKTESKEASRMANKKKKKKDLYIEKHLVLVTTSQQFLPYKLFIAVNSFFQMFIFLKHLTNTY